jgi:radical SAM superfamily enzyme YgiQ (UPF0313 family)
VAGRRSSLPRSKQNENRFSDIAPLSANINLEYPLSILLMPSIVLTTFNARYIHAAFGLRYLFANMGELQGKTAIMEFEIHQKAGEIVEALLAVEPEVIGLGVYIWNAALALEVVELLKRVAPEVKVVLGGPEVSYETDAQPIAQAADYVVTGEADLAFGELCSLLLSGTPPGDKIIAAPLPELSKLRLPYTFYSEADMAHRIIYVEASRGCPFTCEFCLSSLDIPVRQFPLDSFLAALEQMLGRGVRQFKFVDRTFNLNLASSRTILEFFLSRWKPGLFLHFEMVPDRLPEALRELISGFPPGALQFEVGIQTFNPEVAGRIRRRQNYERLEDNFRFLRGQTGVHLHADLIAGLPGESLESFASGFDRLMALGPQEIQVGILKRLRGTPIGRHDTEWEMVYSPFPPYEILRNKLISFAQMQRLRRFSRYWDLVGNSGNFRESVSLLWKGEGSPFKAFLRWSDWLFAREKKTHAIALTRLAELLFEFLIEERALPPGEVAGLLWRDYNRAGRTDKPLFLRPFLPEENIVRTSSENALPKRQARHWVGKPGRASS